MTRRRKLDDQRGKNMLGPANRLASARKEVMRLATNVMSTMTRDPGFTAQDVLNWTILPEHRQVLLAARDVVKYFDTTDIVSSGFTGVGVQFNWEALNIARPQGTIVRIGAATPLGALCERLAHARKQWVNVMAVLEYFDRYGTPASARYYWPTIMTLAGDHPGLNEASSSGRFVDPPGYSKWLPLMRETATTVASALMLGDTKSLDYKSINIAMLQATHTINGESIAWGSDVLPLCD